MNARISKGKLATLSTSAFDTTDLPDAWRMVNSMLHIWFPVFYKYVVFFTLFITAHTKIVFLHHPIHQPCQVNKLLCYIAFL